MGVTQTHLFTEEQNEIAQLAKAIAHPARIAILQHLIKTKSCINGDLVLEIGLAQATISQHLRELKEAGLIQGTIEGTRVNYCINPEKWNGLKSLFEEFFQTYADCCGPAC
ncbi:ArsR/SmtB family transcription factor [Algoriphagus taiwanensis]|uniref:Metalloregulator ArsR/SmtB family transcription factor n=1 Tax=Algoriphagus taiwanensis TaxID=1445656 RepID=A0ABQ6Q1U5_9BACT|nr:metalloregulator ArsR/SmtB family transcription factor [Algoriphagus taiwanensis]